jgi:hypothetical protein
MMSEIHRPRRGIPALRLLGRAGVLCLLTASGPLVEAGRDPDASLERCRYLHERIEHYTRLRRGGGNAAQMERWRTARQKYEREYRTRRCHRYGSRLRIRP